MRFYKYIIYRFYSWRLNVKDNIPETRVVLGMSAIHALQLLIIQQILYKIFPSVKSYIPLDKWLYIGVFIVVVLLYHFFVYNKKKWNYYIEQFKTETEKQRRSGTFLVIGFTVGTIVLNFILAIIFSFF